MKAKQRIVSITTYDRCNFQKKKANQKQAPSQSLLTLPLLFLFPLLLLFLPLLFSIHLLVLLFASFLPSVPCFSSAQPFSRLPLLLPHLLFFIFLHQHPPARGSETGPIISTHSGAPTKEKKAPYLNPLRDTYLLKLAVPHLI